MKIITLSIILCFASSFLNAEGVKTQIKSVKTQTISAKPAATKTGTKKYVSPKKHTVKKSVHSTAAVKKTSTNTEVAANAIKTTQISTSKTPLVPSTSKTYPYLAYTPEGYNKDDKKEWPLIIYLHGSSCKGNNLEKLKKYGPPFYLERGMQVDAIVISPQCPSNKNWTVGTWFDSFYKELKTKYKIDPSRVYLTGMSLGGFGTWDLASRYPDIFAAIVPLCGGGRTNMAEKMKDIPTWVFHGDLDQKVNISRSKEMVNAMKDLGSDPKFSILKGQGHGIQKVYSDQTVYEWLLSHQKKAYARILEISNLWAPRIDSVNTQSNQKSLVDKMFSLPQSGTNQQKKESSKTSIFDIFTKKQPYTQETLH
jgi:predicted peptidase